MKIDGVAGNETLYHKTAYDEESLNVTLKKAGFKDIKRYEWQKTEHVKYDDHSQLIIRIWIKKTVYSLASI